MFTNLQIPAGRRPLTRGEAITTAVFLATIFGLMLIGLAQDFKPVNASIFFILLFWGPLLVLHELGHAIAAWMLGWKVGEISIGFGPQIYFKRWGGTDIRIRMIPLEGFVRPAPRSTGFARTKNTLIFAAGPGAEFLLLALMIGFFGWSGVFNSSEDYFSIALKSLAIVIIFGGGLQLVPFSTGDGGVSDGLGMITSAFTKEADLVDHQFALEFEEVKHLLHSDKPGSALKAEQIIRPLCDKHPTSLRLAFLDCKIDLASGRHDDCLRKAKLLLKPKLNPHVKVELLFLIFLSEIDRNPPGYDEAESAAAEMKKTLPKSPFSHVSDGVLAVRRGRARVGGKILSDVFQSSGGPELDPVILAYLTVAAEQVNDQVAKQRFVTAFKSYRSPKYLRVQLKRLLAADVVGLA